MPRSWHDRHAIKYITNEEDIELYKNIVADKKPYFMRYIYPDLMRQYNTYIKNTNRNAMREFQMDISELQNIPKSELSQRQKEFLRYYNIKMPVGVSDCVMNKICRRFEQEFDKYISNNVPDMTFDYYVMKSGADYTARQYSAINALYVDYNKRIRNYEIFANSERLDKIDTQAELLLMNKEFEQECSKICQNKEVLCDIILDICYSRSATKRFAWNMCGEEIINNLLSRSGGFILYPTLSETGNIAYCGNRFKLEAKRIGVN